ncbi:MAG: hypothetical protein NVSMB22_00260 [Chloroflexota bacterium]
MLIHMRKTRRLRALGERAIPNDEFHSSQGNTMVLYRYNLEPV